MARVSVDFPESYQFSTVLSVRVGDINGANHLGHDRLISLLHEARVRFFQAMGFEEQGVEGVGTIVADLAVSYRNEAFAGDRLRVDIAFTEPGRCGGSFYYRVCNEVSGVEIAIAKTGVVFFDYASRSAVTIPVAFITKVGQLNEC